MLWPELFFRTVESSALVLQAWFGVAPHATINNLTERAMREKAEHTLIIPSFENDEPIMCPPLSAANFVVETVPIPREKTSFLLSDPPSPESDYKSYYLIPQIAPNSDIAIPEGCIPIVVTHTQDQNGPFVVITFQGLEYLYSSLGVDIDLTYIAAKNHDNFTLDMQTYLINDSSARIIAGDYSVDITLYAKSNQLIIPTRTVKDEDTKEEKIYVDWPNTNLELPNLIGFIRQQIQADHPEAGMTDYVDLYGIPAIHPTAVETIMSLYPPISIETPTVTVTPPPIEETKNEPSPWASLLVPTSSQKADTVMLKVTPTEKAKLRVFQTLPSDQATTLWDELTKPTEGPDTIMEHIKQIQDSTSFWTLISNILTSKEKDIPVLATKETISEPTSLVVLYTKKVAGGIVVVSYDPNFLITNPKVIPPLLITTLRNPLIGASATEITRFTVLAGSSLENPTASTILESRSFAQIDHNSSPRSRTILMPDQYLTALSAAPTKAQADLLELAYQAQPTISGYVLNADGVSVPINFPSTISLIGGGLRRLPGDDSGTMYCYSTLAGPAYNFPNYIDRAVIEGFNLELTKIFPQGVPSSLTIYVGLNNAYSVLEDPLPVNPVAITPTNSPSISSQ